MAFGARALILVLLPFFASLSVAAPYPASQLAYQEKGLQPIMKRKGPAGFLELVVKLAEKFQADAWDTEKIPNVCQLGMGTEGGGHCWAYVDCQGDKREYKEDQWSQCFFEGNSTFNDDRIGDFSVKWTGAGGKNSKKDGLHGPVFALKNVGPWEPVDVEDNMFDLGNGGGGGSSGKLCKLGLGNEGDIRDHSVDGKKLAWKCGVPKAGTEAVGSVSDTGNDDNVPLNGGTCSIHVTQYQVPPKPNAHYSLEAKIYDSKGLIIGHLDKTVSMNQVDVGSKLPHYVLVSTAAIGSVKNTDAEPVSFAYAGDEWDSNDSRCKVGAYDSGDRDMDCTFSC